MIKCKICNKSFKVITKSHLAGDGHYITIEKYCKRFPNAKLISSEFSESHSGKNNSMYGKHMSIEAKKKASAKLKGREVWNSGLTKKNNKSIAKMAKQKSKNLRGKNNPNYGNHPTPWNKGLNKETDKRVALNAKHTSETCSDGRRKGKNHPLYHVPRSDKTKNKQSKTQKANWSDPKSVYNSEEYWDNRNILAIAKPSKLEKTFNELVIAEFGKDVWKYTGNGTLPITLKKNGKVISRRNPDFKHRHYRKLIEVFDASDTRDIGKIKRFGSIKNYKLITTRFYRQCGYDVIYFESKDIYNRPEWCLKQLREF